MSLAPDFIEPAAGYRAWRVGQRGELLPFGVNAAPWARGVNEATCERHFIGWRPTTTHVAPAADCTCGFYALHDPTDERLDFYTRPRATSLPAVGAIAAWGDMEVHRTGFRAQFACVIALAEHPRMPRGERESVWRAAELCGVPFVPWDELPAAALREAAPLPHWTRRRCATGAGVRVRSSRMWASSACARSATCGCATTGARPDSA